jgi:hypothetical protein
MNESQTKHDFIDPALASISSATMSTSTDSGQRCLETMRARCAYGE